MTEEVKTIEKELKTKKNKTINIQKRLNRLKKSFQNSKLRQIKVGTFEKKSFLRPIKNFIRERLQAKIAVEMEIVKIYGFNVRVKFNQSEFLKQLKIDQKKIMMT